MDLILLYAKLRAIEIYWNKVANHLLLPDIKLFFKKKRDQELVYVSHCVHPF